MTRILLVDDEIDVCEMFRIFLDRKGYLVRTCLNALDAVREFRSERPDVVLSDYQMPEMNGIELLRALKELDHAIPVILMSGAADMRSAVEALKEDAFDFLKKPIDSKELLQVIETATRRAAQKNAPESEADAGTVYGPVTHALIGANQQVSYVQVHGPLDERSAPRLNTAFSKILEDRILQRKTIISLQNVDYINNVGLTFLIDLEKKLAGNDHATVYTQLSDRVRHYVSTLGYLAYFKVIQNLQEAIHEVA